VLPPDNRFWELLLRYQEDDLSEQDSRELAKLLASEQTARDIFQDFSAQSFSLAAILRPEEHQQSARATSERTPSQLSPAERVQHG